VSGPFVQALLLLALAGVGAIGCILLLDRVPVGWQQWRPIRALAALARDARRLLLRPTSTLPVIALSFAGIALYSLSIYFLARGLGITVTTDDCLVLVPLTMLVTVLPITVGGWVLREGATVFVFGAVGAAPDAALAWSITTGVVVMAVAVVGGLLWLLPRNREHAKKGALSRISR